MSAQIYPALAILAIALVTFATRAIPFLLFGGEKRPSALVLYLGRALPPAMMALLVVYCLKGVNLFTFPHGLPELLAGLAVVGLQVWRKNALLSIFGGTALYMALIRLL